MALGANLPSNFPTIDRFADGVATSIKSVDLNSAIYQDTGRRMARINRYVDQLAAFDGDALADTRIKATAIIRRVLKVAVPKGNVSAVQRMALQAAKVRANNLGVDLVVVPF